MIRIVCRIFLCISLCSCAHTNKPIEGTRKAAYVRGSVQTEPIEGNNHLITVELENLERPQKVHAKASVYVMWFIDAQKTAIKASTLRYHRVKKRASADATIPIKHLTLLITAEPNPNVSTPSEFVVIREKLLL